MKTDSLIRLLQGILAASILLSIVLFLFFYVPSVRKMQQFQKQAMEMNAQRAAAGQIAAEALEYSKTHPAINPILEAYQIKQPTK